MKKRFIGILLTLSMIVSTLSIQSFGAETESVFLDMPDDWSTTALQRAVNNGLINGYDNRIMPKDNLTRAQMGTIINRAFGTEQTASLNGFIDVPQNAWYYREMEKSVFMGTFVGSGNQLNPDDKITRQEVFVALARVFKLTGADQSILDGFSDSNDISQWAKDGIASMIAAGYISGSDGRINPKHNITRAEFAKVMDNLVKTYISDSDTYSANLFGNVIINTPDVTLENMTINGDLIIGDGVGDEEVILNNVAVVGRTIVRGGGVNSILITGNSRVGKIIVARVGGEVRVHAEDGSLVGTVIVDGKDDVILEGDFSRVTATSPDVKIIVQKGNIQSMVIEADRVSLQTNAAAIIKRISVTGSDADIDTSARSEIGEVVVYSSGAKISGDGLVGSVTAKASNVVVTTANTVVTAEENAEGVFFGGIAVAPGTTTGEVTIPVAGIPVDLSGSGGVPAGTVILAEAVIILSPSAYITSHHGTLQLTSDVSPSNVSNDDVTWEVENITGFATIDADGLLTAVYNGLVTVKVTTTDSTAITGTLDINISGQKSDTNTLSDLRVAGNTISGFSSVQETYSYILDYGTVSAPNVTGVPADSKAEVAVANAVDIYSIDAADRTTTVTVTAEDGVAIKSYSVLFDIEAASTDANLSSLKIDDVSVDSFESNQVTYTVVLPKRTTVTPVVTGIASDYNADVSVTAAVDVTSSDPDERTTKVTVTAEDSTTTKVYSVIFDVTPLNTVADLAVLSVNGTMIEGFNKDTETYTFVLPKFTTATPLVTAEAADLAATVSVVNAPDVNSDDTGDRTTTIAVTAEDGSTSKTYSITFDVTPPNDFATLSDIKVSGISVPDFDSAVATYTHVLPKFSTDTPAVTAVLTDSNASYDISPAIDVNSGDINERTTVILVTAENSVDTKTYNVIFEVTPPDTDPTLSSLKVDGSSVANFDSETTTYIYPDLPKFTEETPTVTVVTSYSGAVAVITPASDVTSSDDGDRTTVIVVTAEDEVTEKTYNVVFNVIPPNTDATLSGIVLSEGTINEFVSNIDSYEVELPKRTTITPTITATPTDSSSRVTVEVTDAVDVNSSIAGMRTSVIDVTAEDGITMKRYEIRFNVIPLDDVNTLAGLRYGSTSVPGFVSYTNDYDVTLPIGTTAVPTVTATRTNSNSTLDYDQANSVTSSDLAERTATVTVTAENGDENVYTVVFEVEKNNDATLSDLTVDGTTVTGFLSGTDSYIVELDPGTTAEPDVDGTEMDANASMSITQATDVNSGTDSERTATIEVTAEDGITSKAYTVLFNVAEATEARLSDLTVDGTTVTDFLADGYSYTVVLPVGTTAEPTVGGTEMDGNASMSVTQATDVNSGTDSARTATIEVTAEDGTTMKSYTVLFNVTPASTDATLSDITIGAPGVFSPSFSETTTDYIYTLDNFTATVPSVDFTESDSGANAVVTQNVSDIRDRGNDTARTIEITVTAEDGSTKVYSVQFDMPANDDADLSSITANGNSVGFDPNETDYTYEPLSPTETTPPAIVFEILDDGYATAEDVTPPGDEDDIYIIEVTAEDGSKKTYTVNFVYN